MNTVIKESPKTDPLESAITEYNRENLTMGAIKIFKDAEALECVDAESRQVIGKHRAQIKTFRIQVENKRKDINRTSQEGNNQKATLLVDILNLSFAVFDKKIKAYDSVAEEKKLAKAKLEQERLASIEVFMVQLIKSCDAVIEYNLDSCTLSERILFLEEFKISAADFQEQLDEAEKMRTDRIEWGNEALDKRCEFESEQAIQAKIKAENEAKEKALAEKQAAFDKKQSDAKAEQKKKDDAATKLTAQEAEKTRKANEKLEADRKALDQEKADMEAKKYSDMWDEATKINWSIANNSAIAHNYLFTYGLELAQDIDAGIEKSKLKADKARAKLIDADKEILISIANAYDKYISNTGFPEFETKEAQKMALALVGVLKGTIHAFEESARDLV